MRDALQRLGRRGVEVLLLAGLSSLFVSLDASALTLALPAISHDFGASIPNLSQMGSVLALGALAGLPLGMLADRVGRRRLLIAGVAGFSLVNLASGLAPNLAVLTLLRLLAACFESVAGGVAVALVVEEVPADLRGIAVSALVVAAGAGSGLTTVIWPLLTPHWRLLYLIGGSGLMAAGLLAWRLRESRTWVAASRNERSMPLRLLLSRPWRGRLFVVLAVSMLGAVFYTPAGLFVVLFGSRLGLSAALLSTVIVVSGLLSIPAFPLGGRLSDRWGRRRLGPLLAMASALCAGGTFTGGLPGYWIGNISWSVFASAAQPVTGAWYGELFPTRARATSEALAAVAGAAGAVIGLQLVGVLSPGLGLGHTLVLCAVAPLAAACLLLLLPETRAEPLPE
jgi:MFS family permease